MQHYLTNTVNPYLQSLTANNLNRDFKVHDPNYTVLNLSSNDYLCLTHDRRLQDAANQALRQYGTSSSGSAAVSSYLPIHEELEHVLAEWMQFNSALLWTSGYMANYGLLKYLPKCNDIVIADADMHHSALMGALQSEAKLYRYRHNDLEHLKELLEKHKPLEGNVFVVNEALYSMGGDIPNFQVIAKLKKDYDFIWILDEAHSVGWYGPEGQGLAHENNVHSLVDILLFTFGKSLASQGAVTLFNNESIKQYVINQVKEIWYTTFLSPIHASITLEAIRIVKSEFYHERTVWKEKAALLHELLKPYVFKDKDPMSPIFPLLLKNEAIVLEVQKKLDNRGVRVAAIRPPTVKKDTSRLRLSFNRMLSAENVAQIVLTELLSVHP